MPQQRRDSADANLRGRPAVLGLGLEIYGNNIRNLPVIAANTANILSQGAGKTRAAPSKKAATRRTGAIISANRTRMSYHPRLQPKNGESTMG